MDNIVYFPNQIDKNLETRVFVIDKHESVHRCFNKFFKVADKSIKLSSFTDGNSALKSIYENSPEIVLIDYFLPGLNGIELLEKIKRLPKDQRPESIFLTTSEDYKDIALKLGAIDYIIKDETSMFEVHNRIFLSSQKKWFDTKPLHQVEPKTFEKIKIRGQAEVHRLLRREKDIDELNEAGSFVETTNSVDVSIIDSFWLKVSKNGVLQKLTKNPSNTRNNDFICTLQTKIEDNKSYHIPIWLSRKEELAPLSHIFNDQNNLVKLILLAPMNITRKMTGHWLCYLIGHDIEQESRNYLEQFFVHLSENYAAIVKEFPETPGFELNKLSISDYIERLNNVADLLITKNDNNTSATEHIKQCHSSLESIISDLEKYST